MMEQEAQPTHFGEMEAKVKRSARIAWTRPRTTRRLQSFLLLIVLAVLADCKRQRRGGPQLSTRPPSEGRPTYLFLVHPLHNPARLIQTYQPVIDYVNRGLSGAQLVLEASRDYGKFEEKYRTGKADFLLPNPWQAIQAMKSGYRVIAMAGDPSDFRGILLARRDSRIVTPGDLKGKSVSYPAPTALAACVMPQLFLHEHGIDVNRDITNTYVGSQESSILNAFARQTDAAATWPPPWRAFQKEHPREAKELHVLWQTEPLVNNAIMARAGVPLDVVEQTRSLLLGLDRSQEGRDALAGIETARILPATDTDYDVVRQYVARFEREVRPVEAL